MQDLIKTGTILVKERTALPAGLSVATATYAGGWDAVQNLDGYALGRTLHNAGWTFFCLAGETSSTTFGFGREKCVRTALGRILKKLKLEKFNSLEITEMVSKRFCGIPYLQALRKVATYPRWCDHFPNGRFDSGPLSAGCSMIGATGRPKERQVFILLCVVTGIMMSWLTGRLTQGIGDSTIMHMAAGFGSALSSGNFHACRVCKSCWRVLQTGRHNCQRWSHGVQSSFYCSEQPLRLSLYGLSCSIELSHLQF